MPLRLSSSNALQEIIRSDSSAGAWLDDAAKDLNSRLRDADKKLSGTIVQFLIAWTVFSAIGTGFVKQGAFSSFQITDANGALLVAPPLLGFLYYLIRAYGSSINSIGSAINAIHAARAPWVEPTGLGRLLRLPSVLYVEELARQNEESAFLERFARYWSVFLFLAVMLLPLVAVVHVAFLLWSIPTSPVWVKVASIALGGAFWVRATYLR
jgi:hypothetical protein